jgi:hypothetical protein
MTSGLLRSGAGLIAAAIAFGGGTARVLHAASIDEVIEKHTFPKTTKAQPAAEAAKPTAAAAPDALDVLEGAPALASGAARRMGGAAHGAEAVATEALQLMGEIVADRASQEALRRIEELLLTKLGCDKAGTPFPETCETLTNLRIQDLANPPTRCSRRSARTWFG